MTAPSVRLPLLGRRRFCGQQGQGYLSSDEQAIAVLGYSYWSDRASACEISRNAALTPCCVSHARILSFDAFSALVKDKAREKIEGRRSEDPVAG